jgi:hypothetical protein
MSTHPSSTKPLPPAMSERDVESYVVDLCKLYGILRYHTLRPKGSAAGYPDESLVGTRGFLLRELKGTNGRVSTEQQRWLDRLRSAGVDADVWWPDDLRSGRIQRELEAIR